MIWSPYADAKGETNRILFNAFLNSQANGYSCWLLTIIANNALFEYRDMYLRLDVYIAYEAQVTGRVFRRVTEELLKFVLV